MSPGTVETDSDPRPLAEFSGDLRCELRIGRLVHEAEGLLDVLLRHEAKEWRLFELYRKALTEGAVEDRVTRRVCKIGEDNRVLLGQRVRLAGVQQPTTHRQSDDQHCCASDRPPSNGFQGGFQLDFCCSDGCRTRIGIALQSLQI